MENSFESIKIELLNHILNNGNKGEIVLEYNNTNLSNIKNIKQIIEIGFKRESNNLIVSYNKSKLHFLYDYLIENKNEDIIKFINELVEKIDHEIIYDTLNKIYEFLKFEYGNIHKYENIIIPMYALIKINVDNANVDSEKIIGFDENFEVEIENYRPTLFVKFNDIIQNKIKKNNFIYYNNLLLKYKIFILNNFGLSNDIGEFLSTNFLENVDIKIYNNKIKNCGEKIIELSELENIVIRTIKSKMKDGGIIPANLAKVVYRNCDLNQMEKVKRLESLVKKIRRKIKKAGFENYIKIKIENSTFKLKINNQL